MFLSHLYLFQFKNIVDAQWNFHQKIVAFVGANGVGKTNVLDAIYYLSMTKSYFSSSDVQNIKFNKDFFLIHGKFETDQHEILEIKCNVKKGSGKTILMNEKPYSRLAEHIGKIPVVMMTPYDLSLIIDYADTRRKFVDALISKFDKEYLNALIQYNQHLQNRNILLKQGEMAYQQKDLIEVYNLQIAQLGEIILKKRLQFFNEIKEILNSTYQALQDNNESLQLNYISTIQSNYLQELQNSLSRDIKMGYTCVGIHRDDFDIMLNNYLAKNHASQGQLKTIIMALKWTELVYLYQKTQEHPILMLDDIYDKLDDTRVTKIKQLIHSDIIRQVFITDSHYDRIQKLFDHDNIQIVTMNRQN